MTAQLKNNFCELKTIIYKYSDPSEKLYLNAVIENKLKELKNPTLLDLKKIIDVSTSYLRTKIRSIDLMNLIRETADFMFLHGEKEISLELYQKILSNNKKLKIRMDLLADSYLGIANIYAREGKWEDTKVNLKKAKAIFSRKNNRVGLAQTENFIGTIYAENGEIDKARKQFEYALSFIAKTKNSVTKCKIYNNLGIVCTMMHSYTEAKEYLYKAIDAHEDITEKLNKSEILHNLGMLLMKEGNYNKALELFIRSNKIAIEKDLHPISGISHLGIAEANCYLNNLDEAQIHIIKCQDISYRLNDRLTIADSFKIEALIQKAKHNYEAAESLLLASLTINKEYSNFGNIAETRLQLGLLYHEQKDRRASNYLSDAAIYFNQIKRSPEAAKIAQLTKAA